MSKVVPLLKPVPLLRRPWVIWTLRLAVIGLFLGLWEYAAGRWVEEFIISRPTAVTVAFWEALRSGELWRHTKVTTLELAIGYPIGSLGGIVVGYALGRSKVLAGIFEPLILGLYGVPRTALAPLFIIWLGIGIWSKVGVVIMMTFFLTFFNTYSGILHMDKEFVNLARLMGAKEGTITFRVILPSIFPYVFVGLKTAIPQAVIGAVVGEFIASSEGIGFYIRRAAALFDPAGLWVGVLVLLISVLLTNAAVERIEKWLMRWKPGNQAEGLNADIA